MTLEDQGEKNLIQVYKVKLASGRILGPIDLDRIRLLILKNQIVGLEAAKIYPDGVWQDINQIGPIADLLIAKASGTLTPERTQTYHPILGAGAGAANSETVVLSGSQLEPRPSENLDDDSDKTKVASLNEMPEGEDDDRTRVASMEDIQSSESSSGNSSDSSESEEAEIRLDREEGVELQNSDPTGGSTLTRSKVGTAIAEAREHHISRESTVIFQRPSQLGGLPSPGSSAPGNFPIAGVPQPKAKKKRSLTPLILILALLGVGSEILFPEFSEKKKVVIQVEPIRPQLPHYVSGKADPQASMAAYQEAIKFYLEDTVEGYRSAAAKFRRSAELDAGNVKALAMLASTYINLIDSSNKDENYFTVLSKLIELSRAKNVDLSETVIADVELYLVVNKPEAAQNRIAEYTKSHPSYGVEMFYYLALSFLARGDATSAARYSAFLPDDKPFSSKVFYLKGQIAEQLRDVASAMNQYRKAIAFNRRHAKSHLKIATLLSTQGKLKESAENVEFLMQNTGLMSPSELAQAYYLHGQIAELNQQWDIALADLERAAKLDPDHHDILLELYTLRGKAGESPQVVQKFARMYFFLSEGEKLIKQGKHQEALVPLLQARQANSESPLPPLKIGDMFTYLHDMDNARINYKLAADRAPQDIKVWSKYIQSLIQTYEWDEATKAMDRFRQLPVSQSAIDKAAADIYQKQGKFAEAQTYYRKAMSRESIDPGVYIAYAKSLMSTKNFKDAPFFFALALRFDPLNIDALISTAKCVAETESIDRAISMLQDELNRGSASRAEILAGIAELQIQKGEWDAAQRTVNQAMQANSEYALSYRLQGQIFMSQESTDREALDRALLAYKSYSDRNPSDPSGYLERYKIFARKAEYEKAYDELKRIYEIYPKYPQLHFYLGALYSVQGNHKVAVEEFQKELKNNPLHFQTIMAYGRELLEVGAAQEALNQFNKAMRIDPRSSEAKHYAGWASRALKNFEAGAALIRSAIALDPGNPLLYKRLGMVHQESGNMVQACAAYRKYLEMEPDAPDKANFQGCR